MWHQVSIASGGATQAGFALGFSAGRVSRQGVGQTVHGLPRSQVTFFRAATGSQGLGIKRRFRGLLIHYFLLTLANLLGKTLLQLARRLGKKDPRSIRIELRISHEELASMVGTTRPRISMFMQRFRNLGLIETSLQHHLIVKEKKLTNYLASIA